MERVSPSNTATVVDEIDETQGLGTQPPTCYPSLLGDASSFLVTLSIRAAQNHAVTCLDEWIAPARPATWWPRRSTGA